MRSFLKLLSKYVRFPLDNSLPVPTVKELLISSRKLPKKSKLVVLSLGLFGIGLVFTGLTLGSASLLVTTPVRAGVLREGIVGTPRFINPLLATTDADKDLSSLVYSGLLRISGAEMFKPDLAESYFISEDGLTYTFVLKSNLTWHDDTPVSARDVTFSIRMAQDNQVKSPRESSWEGVLVEELDDLTVRMTLKEPYAPFIENTTMGILPEHLWKSVRPEEFALNVLNLRPVGTGPYKIKAVQSDQTGVPTSVSLEPFANFALGEANIKELILNFYSSEEDLMKAYRQGQVESLSGVSTEVFQQLDSQNKVSIKLDMPRIFGVFFNQNQSPVLAEAAVREALDAAVSRKNIVDLALGGLARAQDTPLPNLNKDANVEADPTRAEEILEEAGWQKGEDGIRMKKGKRLKVEISTSDSPELKKVAAILSENWQSIGVEVVVKVYEPSDLNVNVLRPRKFEALLIGQGLGHFPDPYAFWHSNQRIDLGLNVAQYTNSEVNKALETIRQSVNIKDRQAQYEILAEEIVSDQPAIFLYSPQFAYIPASGIKGINIPFLSTPSDRFGQVNKWFLETERVWSIFSTDRK